MPKRDKQPAFTHSRAIFTEGTEDAAFLRALTNARGLQFDIRANVNLGGTPGNSGFKSAIEACEPITGFNNISDVVLVADNDEHATNSFKGIVDQIDQLIGSGLLNRPWAIPTKPEESAHGDPSVSIWMWPSPGRRGCLETLLWKVIRKEHPKWAQCAEKGCECTRVKRPLYNHRDKALMRTFISISCEKPIPSVTKIWVDEPGLIPLDHKEFNRVAKFLASL